MRHGMSGMREIHGVTHAGIVHAGVSELRATSEAYERMRAGKIKATREQIAGAYERMRFWLHAVETLGGGRVPYKP